MDDNPGISLFHNSNFESVKSNLPAPEEIEAEQDQIRYRRELEQILETEFDDLADIGNSSLNSSYSVSIGEYNNSSLEKEHNDQRKSKEKLKINDLSVKDRHQHKLRDYSSLEQLEVLYGVRLREIEQLRDEIKHLKEKYETENSELIVALKNAQADKEKTTVSYNETQKLLLETTYRLSETEKELSNIRQKCLESDQIKSNALHELEMCSVTIREQEKRLMVAEKNSYKTEEKRFDNLLKEVTSKHKRELSNFEKEINNINNKLKTKEIDYAKLEQQFIDLRRFHESALNEKSKIINKLNENLRECRSQYQVLVSNNTNRDISEVMNQLQQQIDENGSLRREIGTLKESIAQHERASKKRNNSFPLNVNETVKLKEELQQAMINLQSKYSEIKCLQDQLQSSYKEIKTLKNAEIKYVSEIEELMKDKENYSMELMKSHQNQEMLKIGIMDYVTKTDILHQEQLSELELVSSKKILELEAKIREIENYVKENTVRVFEEEIDRITKIYSSHFDKLAETIERLKIELEEKILQYGYANDKINKLTTEMDKIYNKYYNTRKIAMSLKHIVEDRTLLLKQRNKQYIQTLEELRKNLDNLLVGNTIDNDKLTELIEKSTKNTVHVDELLDNEEMNAVMCEIGKKLSYLEKPDT